MRSDRDNQTRFIERRRLPAPGLRAQVRHAFTMIEVLIVIGLIALLASITWPALDSQIRAAEMPDSATRFRSMLFMARNEAVLEHRRIRVRFVPERQQPIVEMELDPIRAPGVFSKVTSPWAREPVLLANVQVHEVEIGRPVWTKPMSENEDAEAEADDVEEEVEAREEREADQALALRDVLDDSEDTDENRPSIVFEPDGSSDWAVYIIARIVPEEELAEEDPQIWVLLDGRTGLAAVRDKVTEEQLGDSEFYVNRDMLAVPEHVYATGPSRFSSAGGGGLSSLLSTGSVGTLASQQQSSGGGSSGGGRSGQNNNSSGENSLETAIKDAASGASTNSQGTGGRGQGQGRGRGNTPGTDRASTGSVSERAGGSTKRPRAQDQLENELDDSDLTDEERDNVRRAFDGM